MEKVVIRAHPIGETTEWRRGAWEQLCLLPDSKIVRCIETSEEAGWRYEVTAVPPAMTLREWLACHRPGFGDIESFTRQMAATLGALHAQGVVHLNVRPESIHLDETARVPVFLLGGLEAATLYTQPKLTATEVDPRYAPPEAMEPELHRAGTRLCAWDWWSVGRIVQELVLGRHVLSLVLERDLVPFTAELRTSAEALLRETAPAGIRAGALDYMPPDPPTAGLLRGLLTSSCEARWGLDAVQRWLRREAVRDHYDLPRAARLWIWRGRGFALAEAAEFFTQAANWADGENVLFYEHDPESLAYFLNETRVHRAEADRLQAVCELTGTQAWEEVPAVVRRTVTAAVAWLALATGNAVRAHFRVCGQTIDLPGLGELLKLPDGQGVALVSALLTPPLIEYLEPLDGSAARTLKLLAATGGVAVKRAWQENWLDPHDGDGQGRILGLALLRIATLRERVSLLQATYATNRQPALARLLASREPTATELVLLLFTAEAPDQHGYVTHAAWRRERETELKGQAERIVVGLFWGRLRRLYALARLWGLPWPVFATITLVLTAIAGWIGRAAEPAAMAAAGLLLSRAWLWFRVRGMVSRFDPAASSWNWRDGFERSAAEAQRVLSTAKIAGPEMAEERRRLGGALAEFVSRSAARRAVALPQLWDVALVLMLGGGLTSLAVVLAATTPRAAPHPAEIPAVVAAPISAVQPAAAAAVMKLPTDVPLADAANDPDRLLATGRYEILDDGFGRRLRGPLRPWDLTAPAVATPLAVEASARASPEQAAFALVSGNLLVQPYTRKSINVMLAVRVPTSRGVGLLIFNTRDRRLVDHEIQLVKTPLAERTWYQLGSRRVIFLGVPAALEPEISLAPP